MRYYYAISLIVLGLSMIGLAAFANDVPPALKGAVITVTLKNGQSYSFKAEDHKVVPRIDAKPAAKLEVAKEAAPKRNRVRLIGGSGPTDLETSVGPSSVTVKSTSGAVGGVGYDRLLNNSLSIGGQALTNETYLINLGLDF